MAQVPFGMCVDPRVLQRNLAPPQIGKYTVCLPAPCDRGKMKHKIPHVETLRGPDGLGVRDERPLEMVITEQGPFRIGYGPAMNTGYMPSTRTLSEAPFHDTRRTGISDRYYK